MPKAPKEKRLIIWLLRFPLIALFWAAALAAETWATLAINYSNLPWPWLRATTAAAFAIGSIGAIILVRPRRRATLMCAAGFAIVLVWYDLIPPSNQRDWQPDVARTPTISIDGDSVIVHDVRDCAYRSETDFDVRYEDRSYDLSKLRSLDLIMSYWGPRHICHTMLTFVFEDGRRLCCSIETRKEKSESYSAVRGMFRQFELVYIFADERDLIGLRTDFRKEEVYLYHMPTPRDRAKAYFLDYARRANSLAAEPEWYNAITDSCSTNIIYHAWVARGDSPFRVRWLLNGHWDEFAYGAGLLDTSIPFAALRERSRINGKASATEPDFSDRIRIGLPMAVHPPLTDG